jgi:hypothetical protein
MNHIIPFDLAVERGEVPGWSKVVIVGHDAAAAQARAILAFGNATGIIAPNALLATPALVFVASTHDTEDDASGIGARSTTIYGLDANGDPQSETIVHHATSANTAVTSVNLYSAIQYAEVATVGTSLDNTGTIWVGTGSFTAGVPAVGLCSIEPARNRSATGIYTVPAGNKFYPTRMSFTAGGASAFKAANVDFSHYVGTFEHEMFSAHVGEGDTLSMELSTDEFIGAGEQVRIRGGTTSLTGSVTVRLEGYLVADESPTNVRSATRVNS